MMKVTSNPDFIIPNNQIEYGQKLGEGGFGVVYKAVWNYVDVAVKKLMMELSESVMQEFEKEVEVHSKLRNPYIVQIFGITETYGMVMEYMSRGSLRNVLEKNRREEFSWTMRNKIAMDMLIGLSYLHQKHIIHRDLKSLNVLLDDQYKAKLADFGLAKVRSEISSRHSAQSGGAKGTTQWMAPELFELDPDYTPKTDVFSFGIVLWELAAHEYPYKKANPNVVPMLVMQGRRETFPLDTPEGYAQLAQQCWDGTPDKRPTVNEAIHLLKSMNEGSNEKTISTSLSNSSPVNSNHQPISSLSYMPNTHQPTSQSGYIPNTNQLTPPSYMPNTNQQGSLSPYIPNTNLSISPFPLKPLPQGKPLLKPLQKPFIPLIKSNNPKNLSFVSTQLPSCAFGAAEWEKYFDVIGVEPPLPKDIDQILSSPCPFWPSKKVQETHLLVLVPQTVNGKPLTLKALGELVKKPLTGSATQYRYFKLGEYTDPAAPSSHWVLMTRGVIEGSRKKSYQEQQKLVNQKGQGVYEVPTVLDAAVCIFMEHVRSGNRLYSDSPDTLTNCQEKYDAYAQLNVGGFVSGGLLVSNYLDYGSIGVGAVRKFNVTESDTKPHFNNSYPASTPTNNSNSFTNNNSPINQIQQSKKPQLISFHKSSTPQLPSCAFGAAKWKKYFGDIGVEPSLPLDIDQILSSPCPFWPSKKVQETHLLVLVPQTVNGQPLTLKTLNELVKKPLQGPTTRYSYFNIGQYTDPAAPHSHWVLMTCDVIEGSRNKSYQDQQKLLHQKGHSGYEVPTILDATVCIFMEHIQSGTRIYGNRPLTYTRCQEKHDAKDQLVVGGFASGGLYVSYDFDFGREYYGVGAGRKL